MVILLIMFILLSAECGLCMNMTREGGIIESPDFPDDYDSNLNCLFNLNAPLGKKIELTFIEFSVKNVTDSISVSEHIQY